MQHVTEEQLVSHYYHDEAQAAEIGRHLESCNECRASFDMIRRVLDLVAKSEVPDPGEAYPEQVWNRLRWKLGSSRRRPTWLPTLAAAAAIVVAFLAGEWWHVRNSAPAGFSQPASLNVSTAANRQDKVSDRVLLVVVSDHFESSNRVLTELANADPGHGLDFTEQQKRATDLVASNRIYRQSAIQNGDRRLASLLSDLEPILVELSHSGTTLSREELASIQHRIESKGLLFKVRVMSAQAADEAPPAPKSNSL